MRISHTGSFEGKFRLAAGASTLALGLAMAATPARAQQVVVGSVQCPVVAGTATCEGNLSGGVSSQQRFGHVPVRTINVRNTTATIAPNGIFGIGGERSEGPLTVNVADGVVIDVFDNLTIAEPAQGIIFLLRGGHALVIDSGATITSNGGGRGVGGPGAGIEGDAYGAGGSVTITNRGQITSNSTTHRSTAIAGQLAEGGNGNIAITNSGALFANSTATGERDNVVAGILASDGGAAPSSGLITINNTGAITVRTDPNAPNSTAGGNAAGIVTNGLSSNSNTTITNSGALDSQGQRANGIFAFSRGNVLTGDTSIVVENTGTMRIDGTGSGILAQTQGEKVDIALRNRATGVINITGANGSNTPSTGILALSQARTGVLSIDNAAAITTAGSGFSRGIGITTGGAPAGGNYTMSIANTANITIGTTSGQGLRIDATRDDTATATVTNSGAINLSATTIASSAGITVNLGLTGTGDAATSATVMNSGAITVGAGNGIAVSADAITVTNSAAITTAAATSDAVLLIGTGTGAIRLTSSANIRAQGANSDAIAIYGTGSAALIDLNGASVQAPTGIANSENYVVRVAGDINTILTPTNGSTLTGNLIFAGGSDRIVLAAGNRIAGDIALGAGGDTIDNSGRIEGAIAFGTGADQALLRAGGVITGALDGGDGIDTIQFDAGSGSVAFGDRVGGAVTNFEVLEKGGNGTLILTQVPAARTELNAGTLITNGALGAMAVNARGGTTLDVTGSLGAVTLADGLLGNAPTDGATLSVAGAAVGTITLASLALSDDSRLRFDLGAPNVVGGTTNDLIVVTGNLVLDGQVDVVATPAFGNGVYRLINYGGTLTDGGLLTGNVPNATYQVQTAVAGQVNLVVGGIVNTTPTTQFWDGPGTTANNIVGGGTGTWNTTTTNWTRANGDINDAWGSNFAVFQGTAGTVTIAPGGVSATGAQFVTSGYRVEGGTLTLNAPATLRVGDGTAAGAATTATIASSIAGTGGIEKTDLGTLILTGANAYTGGTRVSGGVLSVANDGALGAAAGAVTLDGGTLRAGGALTSARGFSVGTGGGTLDLGTNATTLSGVLGGAGALTVTGSSILTLSGNSAARTGATRVAGGTLALAGTLGGQLTIASGAMLTGTGTTGNLIVEGRVAPGTSPGTLSVNGNVSFAAGSTYAVELGAAGATDRINATGTATLNGGTVAITTLDPELSYTNGSSYRILNAAGGRTGTFAGLSETSAFLDFTLVYDPTGVNVNLAVVRTFPDVARTFNQRNAANGLRDLTQAAGSDALSVYQTVLMLDADPARAAFDLASGEIHATSLASARRQGSALAERLSGRAFATSGAGWGIWGGASGHDGRVAGDGNGARYTHDAIGGDLGIDYRGADNRWALGIGGGKFGGGVSLAARNARAKTDGWQIGSYGRFGTGNTGFTGVASVAFATANNDTSRAIAFGALARTATVRTKLTSVTATLDLRYGVGWDGWAVGPVVGIEHGTARIGGFAEIGANSLNLSGVRQSDSATRGSIGAFANLQSALGSIDLSARYARGGGDPTEIGLRLAGSPTAFRVRSAAGSNDALLLRLSGDYSLGGGWSLGGDLRGSFARYERSVAGAATVRFAF